MSDADPAAPATADPTTALAQAQARQAGELLRAARERQGLHIDALATAIKVAPAKLVALEAGRFDELPDLTFARALALTVCRQLKIDAAAVLAQLPGAPASRLEKVDRGLNTPFRDRPGQADPAAWLPWRRPLPWAVAAILLLAAAFVLVPMRVDLLANGGGSAAVPVMPPAADPASAPAAAASSAPTVTVLPGDAPAAVAPAVSASMPVGLSASAPLSPVAAADTAAPADKPDLVVLRAVQDTWVQATDAGGQVLTARLIPAGEIVELAGRLPVKLRIGNARGTELRFRGDAVDLTRLTRDNVVNLSLP
jgi:cytoskeleton protein RodZ